MPAGARLDIADLAERIFNAIVTHYDAYAAGCLPSRRVIAPGESRSIAWDQEQFVLTFSGIGRGNAPGLGGGTSQARPRGNPVSAMGVRHAVFTVQLVRCVPESAIPPPKPEVLRASAVQLMDDAGLLSQALIDVCTRVQSGLPPGSVCEAGAVEVLGPLGGFAGVEASIAVTAGTLIGP